MTIKPELSAELRTMVREALREAIARRPGSPAPAVESVRMTSDADLQAFVQRLLEPGTQERLKAGKLKFALAATNASASAPAAAAVAPGAAADLLTGVVSEKAIDRLKGVRAIALAPGAVLTPLARDRARQLGIRIERRR